MKISTRLTAAMTPFPTAVSLDDRLDRAFQIMLDHEIHHLPVQDEHALVGVISERDIQVALAARFDFAESEMLKVGDVCTRDPYTVSVDEPLADVLDAMVQRNIGSVLVTRHGNLAGIFTVTDACRALAAALRGSQPLSDGPQAA